MREGNARYAGTGAIAVLVCAALAVTGLAGSGGTDVSRYRVGEQPIDIAIGDFNRDGRKDLAVTNFADDPHTISILRGRAQGRFAKAKKLVIDPDNQPDGIAAARIGGGKDQDLVVGTLGADVLVFKGRKGAGFAQPRLLPLGAFSNPREVAAGDFDHDGTTDLAVSRQGPEDIAVLLGEGGLNFGSEVSYGGAGGAPVLAERLDPGNDLDLLTIDFAIDGLALFRGNGNGTFDPPEPLNAGEEPASIAVADLNGDGRNDIVSGLLGDRPRVSISRGQAGGTFAPQEVLTLGPRPMFVRDIALTRLNGDNDPDFVIVGPQTGAVRAAHSSARGDPEPPGRSRVIFLKGRARIGLKRVREIGFTHDTAAVVAGRFDGCVADAAVTRARFGKRGQAVVILNP
jgi:hypothetical protein